MKKTDGGLKLGKMLAKTGEVNSYVRLLQNIIAYFPI